MRIYTRTRQSRGASRRCGRAGCGREILAGERYHQFTFYRGSTQYRCAEHYPKQSELTQSRVADVYAAVEAAEDELDAVAAVEEAEALVSQVAEAARAVAEEYRQADEAFGGYGATENAQRADELESWADGLDNWATDAVEPEREDPENRRERVEESMERDGFSRDDEAEWASVLETRLREAEDEADPDAEAEREEFLDRLREDVREAIGGCPL